MNNEIKRASWEHTLEYYPAKPKTYTKSIILATIALFLIWYAITATHLLDYMIIIADL